MCRFNKIVRSAPFSCAGRLAPRAIGRPREGIAGVFANSVRTVDEAARGSENQSKDTTRMGLPESAAVTVHRWQQQAYRQSPVLTLKGRGSDALCNVQDLAQRQAGVPDRDRHWTGRER